MLFQRASNLRRKDEHPSERTKCISTSFLTQHLGDRGRQFSVSWRSGFSTYQVPGQQKPNSENLSQKGVEWGDCRDLPPGQVPSLVSEGGGVLAIFLILPHLCAAGFAYTQGARVCSPSAPSSGFGVNRQIIGGTPLSYLQSAPADASL